MSARHERDRGVRIVGVELAEGAVRLADLVPARGPTVVVLGHESTHQNGHSVLRPASSTAMAVKVASVKPPSV